VILLNPADAAVDAGAAVDGAVLAGSVDESGITADRPAAKLPARPLNQMDVPEVAPLPVDSLRRVLDGLRQLG